MKKSFSRSIFLPAIFVLLAVGVYARPAQESGSAVPLKGKIILSTTTSTWDSGLLNVLLPVFTRETGWEVDAIPVGTGAALRMGRDGDADVLLVHSKAEEIEFVEERLRGKAF
jgi:ABC-type tungstate transport system permease subunit